MKNKDSLDLFSCAAKVFLFFVIILGIVALSFFGTQIIDEFLWQTVPKLLSESLFTLHSISIFFFLFLLLICLPLSFINKLKKILSFLFFLGVFVFWFNAWVWSYLLCLSIWGIWPVIIGIICGVIGIIPIAFFACMFDGQWVVLLQLIILIIIGSVSRFYGSLLKEKAYDFSI